MGVGGCSGVVCVFRLVWGVCRLGCVRIAGRWVPREGGVGGGRLSVLVGRIESFGRVGLAGGLRASRDRRVGSSFSCRSF